MILSGGDKLCTYVIHTDRLKHCLLDKHCLLAIRLIIELDSITYTKSRTMTNVCLGNPVDSLLIKMLKVLEKYLNICKLLFGL